MHCILPVLEIANVDVFLTTDDRLLRKATTHQDRIKVQVANPLSWLMEVAEVN